MSGTAAPYFIIFSSPLFVNQAARRCTTKSVYIISLLNIMRQILRDTLVRLYCYKH